MITKVVFRRYPNGEIVALFPELPAVPQGFLCVSYQHIGQHGAADYDLVISQTTPAEAVQYGAPPAGAGGARLRYAYSQEDAKMRYKDFRPTTFDVKGISWSCGRDWLVVPVTRTRDSDLLAECNFEAALEILGGESDTVEVHRFKHWGPGWYEIILVHPDREAEVGAVEQALADDECLDWSRMRLLQQEAWERMDIRDRMWVCIKNGMSRFRARSDVVPALPYDAL